MTKKDYEALAGTFRRCIGIANPDSESTLKGFAYEIADILEADNPRFDRSRFLAACRGEDSKDSAGRKVTYAR